MPQGNSDRMVPLSKGLPRNRKRTRRSRHRPVRHSPEPPDSGLHQPLSGPECPFPGCSQRRLEHSPSFRRCPSCRRSFRRYGTHRWTSYWWLRRGRRSPGSWTYSISPHQPHSRFWSSQTSRRRCNARLGRTATPECKTTTLGCCPGFPQRERLFSGDC